MDKQHCRFLLRACRPNGADASDPAVSEAIQQARLDPVLGAWFDREQAIDGAIAEKLAEVRPPAELRGQILAGLELSSRRRSSRPLVFALTAVAACAALAAGLYSAYSPRPIALQPFDTVVASAFDESRSSGSLAYYTTSLSEARTWLTSEHAPTPATIPAAFAKLATIGCKTLNWNGMPASLVCFRVPALYQDEAGRMVDVVMHLYTVEGRSCRGGPASRDPMVFTKDQQTMATWRDDTRFYVLMTRAPEEVLRRFLAEDAATTVAEVDLGAGTAIREATRIAGI